MNDTILWPDCFGVPQRAGYSYTPADRRAKAEMEIGSRCRVLYDTDETALHCDFVLQYDRLAFFEAFEKHILRQGSVWFQMPILTAGVLERHIVRFRERPKMSEFTNGIAVVSMALDVRERNVMSGTVAWFLYRYGIDAVKHIDRLHAALHVEAPGVTIIPVDL